MAGHLFEFGEGLHRHDGRVLAGLGAFRDHVLTQKFLCLDRRADRARLHAELRVGLVLRLHLPLPGRIIHVLQRELGSHLKLDGVVRAGGVSEYRKPIAETPPRRLIHIHRALELPILRDHQVVGRFSLTEALVNDLDLLHQDIVSARTGLALERVGGGGGVSQARTRH